MNAKTNVDEKEAINKKHLVKLAYNYNKNQHMSKFVNHNSMQNM